ncbi:hypothetical protein ACHAW5_002028 [Stephanodiscus triporus]|uniref:IST1 homolog n=1 Tax=Stephanodiscus triporus TaxID=2934178 RepID=A0ABD3QKG3_9STRA
MAIFGGYDELKLKPQLKMAVTRFSIAANKKSALCKQQRREIAMLLDERPPKEEKARIKAEALIRDDDTIEAYEILQLDCELLSERIKLISHGGGACPPDLVECVSTLIWASAVVDVPELVEARKQFRHRYGRNFEEDALRNAGGVVNERVARKLSIQPPSAYLVQVYLEKIADEHGVRWKPSAPLTPEEMSEPTRTPTGTSVLSRGRPSLTVRVKPPATTPPPPFVNEERLKYVPVLPTPSSPNITLPEDIDEDDIFVPGRSKESRGIPPPPLPGVGGGGRRGSGGDGDGGGGRRGSGDESSSQRSDNDDNIIPEISHKGFGGGRADVSYDDLAAKFASLQR